MILSEYKQSIADIRALINDRGHLRSKFGRFTINERQNIYGIWNCLSKNVIVVINTRSKLIRVRRNSVYAPTLSNLKDWKTVQSDGLAKYRSYGMNYHAEIYLNHVARPQYEAINKLIAPADYKIDLGIDKELRRQVFNAITSNLTIKNVDFSKDATDDRYLTASVEIPAPVNVSSTASDQSDFKIGDTRRDHSEIYDGKNWWPINSSNIDVVSCIMNSTSETIRDALRRQLAATNTVNPIFAIPTPNGFISSSDMWSDLSMINTNNGF